MLGTGYNPPKYEDPNAFQQKGWLQHPTRNIRSVAGEQGWSWTPGQEEAEWGRHSIMGDSYGEAVAQLRSTVAKLNDAAAQIARHLDAAAKFGPKGLAIALRHGKAAYQGLRGVLDQMNFDMKGAPGVRQKLEV